MTRQEQNIRHLKKSIEHCISLVALCRAQGNVKAEASYEKRLKELGAELEKLQGHLDVYSRLITDLERQNALGEIE